MAFDAFIWIDGFAGESRDSAHQEWIRPLPSIWRRRKVFLELPVLRAVQPSAGSISVISVS
ncbi:hypothetical protein BV326_05651 [Pseudomonas syringae pv. actinidiae]|nr:hypothetical protein BV326_05651 [Pseudomonas syringae pv. actinidiae]